ncbi:MAG TPA: serine hydrolase domain-containing protein [Gemmatimonadales bacterium]|nr:serine hydrolase domain-containing protein [Gemmatimonadales bacterium]
MQVGRLLLAGGLITVPLTSVTRPAAAQATTSCITTSYASAAPFQAAIAAAQRLICDSLAPKIPGLQVAVAIDGKLVWSAAFGFADVARRTRVTRTTMFRIGSVSKPLTSVAVAQLVLGGKLDLDAPVQRYVPSFPQKPWPVTTRELAGHLAGIRHYQGNEFLLNTPYPSVTAGLAIFENDSLLFEPGTRFSYSSYGFNLISAVVEGASGEKFLAYMGAHVIRPLGLTHTAPDRADSLIPERTTFYDPDTVHGGFQVAPQVDNSYKWAGGGFLSSAEDLVRFASALDQPGFLPQSALDLLFTSQKTRDGQLTGYGVGWFVRTDSLGHRRVFHGGGSVGGTTAFGMDRDAHVAFALTSNLTDAPLGPASRILPLFVTAGNPRGR